MARTPKSGARSAPAFPMYEPARSPKSAVMPSSSWLSWIVSTPALWTALTGRTGVQLPVHRSKSGSAPSAEAATTTSAPWADPVAGLRSASRNTCTLSPAASSARFGVATVIRSTPDAVVSTVRAPMSGPAPDSAVPSANEAGAAVRYCGRGSAASVGSAASAASTSTRGNATPMRVSVTGVPVDSSTDSICAGCRSGRACRSSAAAPATCGAEKDVPKTSGCRRRPWRW